MITPVLRHTVWTVPSDLAEVRPSANRLLAFFGELVLSESHRFDIRLCFEESIINAMKYGNGLKREVTVTVEAAYNDQEIFIAVEDHGPGFDPSRVKDPTEAGNIEAFSGRGVYLIRHLMDRVDYNPKGNRIEMVKVHKKPARVA